MHASVQCNVNVVYMGCNDTSIYGNRTQYGNVIDARIDYVADLKNIITSCASICCSSVCCSFVLHLYLFICLFLLCFPLSTVGFVHSFFWQSEKHTTNISRLIFVARCDCCCCCCFDIHSVTHVAEL